jgi:hypothetical protein
VAVVEVHSVRPRGKPVLELLVLVDDLEDAVHPRGVDAVEVDRVGMLALVPEANDEKVVLRRANHRARRGAVVGPRREHHALRDLDLDVARDEVVLPAAAGLVRQRGRRGQKRIDRRAAIGGGDVRADHRGVALGLPVADDAQVVGRLVGVGERRPDERPGCDERGGGSDELPSREFRHT